MLRHLPTLETLHNEWLNIFTLFLINKDNNNKIINFKMGIEYTTVVFTVIRYANEPGGLQIINNLLKNNTNTSEYGGGA